MTRKTQYLMVRQEKRQSQITAAQLTLTTSSLDERDNNALFLDFQRAITRWINNTAEGCQLWHFSQHDLNIGDLADDDSDKTAYLQRYGIAAYDIVMLTGDNGFCYDTVLAVTDEIEPAGHSVHG